MIRILIVHPAPTRGGFSAVVSQAKELLDRGDFDVTLAVAAGPRLAEVPTDARLVILKHRMATVKGIVELRKTIKSLRPDVVHLHGRKAGLIGRLAIPRRRPPSVLYTPHGTVWTGTSWLKFAANDAMERLLLPRTCYVLCVSRAEQSDWVRRDTSSRVRFFPNLLSVSPAGGAPAVTAGDRDPVEVLVPSGYSPQKRLSVVIEAMALLPEPRPTVLITGSADRHEEVEAAARLAETLGVAESFTFGGNLPNIAQLLIAARLVVLPSYSEGMPIVGEEAIAAGASVAWSAIPPHFELFANCGVSFWTPEELATLLMLPRGSASVAGRRDWQVDRQREVRALRTAFWDEIKANTGTAR